jgi:DNA-directed RNA polymerase specialized sigma24 family protein
MISTPDPDRPTPAPKERSPLATQVSETMRRHIDGDPAAITDLTRTIGPWLHHIVRTVRLPSHAVEDVVQATLLSLVQHVHTLRDPDAGLAWISIVARREALREARALQRYVLVDDPDVLVDSAPAVDPAEIVLDRLSQAVVGSTVKRLPTRPRVLLERIALEDRPNYAAISIALKMPVGSIGPTRRRGLDRMRQMLIHDSAWEWDVSA